jgi:hypothetical protein
MMTNATAALDPIAAATAIATNARHRTESRDDRQGTAAVIALAIGVLLSLIVVVAMVTSPATIPMWCASHGCPNVMSIWQPYSAS